MPLPKPNTGETKDSFISRCMEDETIRSEYPDTDQRYAVCSAQFKETNKFTKSMDMEIFAIGTWNEIPFSKKDLQNIITNFTNLNGIITPFLKLGHEDKESQKLGEKGQPALGKIEKLWLNAKNVLMAKVTDMPDVVYNAIKKKLYKNVSIEISTGVIYKGNDIGTVLEAVAILGADFPAVNTLADLQTYMNADIFSRSDIMCFTAIKLNEEYEMSELTEMAAKLDKLVAKIDVVSEENKTLRSENEKLSGEVKDFSKKESDSKEAEKKLAIKTSRDSVTSLLEDAVKEKKILPAQREQFSKLLQIDDDEMVQKVDMELLKTMVEKGSVGFTTKKAYGNKSAEGDEDTDMTVDEKVLLESRKLVGSGVAKTISSAMNMVFQADKKLAEEFRDMNG